MKVSELMEKLDLSLLTDPAFCDKEINGCYIGDLLSWVMGRAQQGNVWVTIMNNINIVAVASLTDVSAIILAEDVSLAEDVIKKADSEEIIILKSGMSAYELATEIGKLI